MAYEEASGSGSVRSEIMTIMLIDIAGYTKTTTHLDREQFSTFHDIFDRISLPVFHRHGGKVIKKIGDAFLVTFKSPTEAVLCGVDLQNSFNNYSREHNLKDLLQIRVAIHSGEVLLREGDIYGDAVNTVSRIESVTQPGMIFLSETVFQSMNQNEIPCTHIGLRKMKGLKHPIRLFRVKTKYDEILKERKKKQRFIRRIMKTMGLSFYVTMLLFLLITLFAVLVFLTFNYWII